MPRMDCWMSRACPAVRSSKTPSAASCSASPEEWPSGDLDRFTFTHPMGEAAPNHGYLCRGQTLPPCAMKTPLSSLGWILLGLSLCFSPALLSAQDRLSRSHNVVFGRKPETRSFKVTSARPKAPPAIKKIGWVPSNQVRMAPAASYSAQPQRMLATAQLSSTYRTSPEFYNEAQVRPCPSTITILPDGTVVTREGIYGAPMVTEDGTPLNEFDLAAPATSPHEIQYRNSAVAPPPPPVQTTVRTSTVKPDLSAVQTAEKVSFGLVKSPYPPHSLLDVQGMRPGSLAEDPASKKLFRVP